MHRFFLSCVALAALACAVQTWEAPAVLAAVETEPLYCFHGVGSGEILYKAGADAPALAGGLWTSRGVSFVADLRTLGVTVAGAPADADKVYITLEDRLTGERYESGAYTVGWYGVGKLLFPVGCKHFLGRAGQFLCSTEQGMTACENLKKQGKPVQCTRQGQPAK